jgi:hypothetical protein
VCSAGGAGRPVDGRGNRGKLYIGRWAPARERGNERHATDGK